MDKIFFNNRTIQFRVEGEYSDVKHIDNGTQGSVISPVLFNILVNGMFTKVGRGFGLSLFADDGAIWKGGINVGYIMDQMQQALNQVVIWADEWGYKISVAKSKYVIFHFKKVEIKLRASFIW